MPGTYELWLTDDAGLRMADSEGHTLLDNVLDLECSRVVNGIGWMRLTVGRFFDPTLLRPDYMVQVWRQPEGGARSLWRPYFLRKWRYETRGAEQTITLSGPDVNDLLRRRVAVGYAGSSYARKISWADNMMKELVDEATGTNADVPPPVPDAGTRVWSDLSVAADLGLGPILTKAFNWGHLLQPSGGVLVDVAKAAREAGTEVFFDIVPDDVTSSSISFQFRTYTDQPGADRTDTVFSQERGNLEDPFLEYDYSQEINYVYAGGQNEGEARNVQQVYDADRYNLSQWNRCEAFAEARNESTDNGVREKGRALLESGRPVRRLGGTLIDTEGTRFGVDWDFGDRVTARYLNQEFQALIRAVVISVDENGEETVRARPDYEAVA